MPQTQHPCNAIVQSCAAARGENPNKVTVDVVAVAPPILQHLEAGGGSNRDPKGEYQAVPLPSFALPTVARQSKNATFREDIRDILTLPGPAVRPRLANTRSAGAFRFSASGLQPGATPPREGARLPSLLASVGRGQLGLSYCQHSGQPPWPRP